MGIRYTTEIFIEKAVNKHGDKYEYSLVDYIDCKNKVEIICKKHGVFKQKPSEHLYGKGCAKCGDKKESFYKIGKTFNDVTKRFKGKSKSRMPYNYEIVELFKGTAKEMSKLERRLQKENKKFSYIPLKKFEGVTECFSKINTITLC